jgi:hypothetical protein
MTIFVHAIRHKKTKNKTKWQQKSIIKKFGIQMIA